MRKRNVCLLLIASTLAIATVLYSITSSGHILIVALGIICFILLFMWSPPPKHKIFSDEDRIQATSRALGGSGPSELWSPEIHRKQRIPDREFKSIVSEANRSLIRFFLIPIVAALILLGFWIFNP